MHGQRAFTLLELMIVIAITAVLLIIGLPAMDVFVLNNRMTSQLNSFSTSLALARSEAVKRNLHVVLCPSTNGTGCASSGTDWNVGWLVFVDRNKDELVDAAPSGIDACATGVTAYDCILSYTQALQPSTTTLIGNTGDYLFYNGLGVSNMKGMFVLCDQRGAASAKAVLVSTTGRASVSTTQADGSALTCP